MKVDGEEIVKVHNSHLRALVKIELILDYELNWFYLKWLCSVTNFKLLSFLFYKFIDKDIKEIPYPL